jgi:hypothetical protein
MEEVDRLKDDIVKMNAEETVLRTKLRTAETRHTSLDEQVKRVESARDSREKLWLDASQNERDVAALSGVLADRDKQRERNTMLSSEIEELGKQGAGLREAHAGVISRLEEHFTFAIQALLGAGAEGRLKLGADALKATVELGGDRSTAAIDSVKVIAFDLATLLLSIEGRTRLPAFLVHDSPREADLGLSVYHRLFEFAVRLETTGNEPAFQYIVTTTTAPPAAYGEPPYQVLKLMGSPPNERLLMRDL